MGLSRKVAILLGVSAFALAGCGDALWPTTDAPDPKGGQTSAQAAPAPQPSGAPAPQPQQTQQAQTTPPAVSATTPAAATPPPASNGTFVGKKVTEMQGDLAKLRTGVQSLQTRINQLAQRSSADTQKYHNLVASVASRLQQGSTPGNPILTAQWNEAQAVLEQVAGTLPAMTKISNDAADQAAFGQFLLNSVQATFGLSGAVEEDHRRLQILEDEVYQNIVQIDRRMNDLAQDINRQTSYVNNERQNLTTLSLAIKNGELYGTSLATRAFTQSNVIARAEAEAQGPAPGERPLVIIRFDRPNVEYQQALYNAVSQALARLNDGSTLVYGCMGGDGQPQFQAAFFTRAAMYGTPLQAAVTAPRWLLGRGWGEDSTSLKLEGRFPPDVVQRLAAVGHDIEIAADITDQMGHVGAIRRAPYGSLSGAADPRSDGVAAGY